MNRYIGSSLDLFLAEEGVYQEATTTAFQRVLAFRLRQLMRGRHHALQQLSEWLDMEMSLLELCLNPDRSALDGEVLGDIARRLASRSQAEEDEALVALSKLLNSPLDAGDPGDERELHSGFGAFS